METSKKTNAGWVAAKSLLVGAFCEVMCRLVPAGAITEPFDIGSHAGNIQESIAIGGIMAVAGCTVLDRLNIKSAKYKKAGFILGATAALAANVVAESKFGQPLVQHIYQNSTPDSLDAVYGAVAGLGAAAYAAGDYESKIIEVPSTPDMDR